MSEPVDILLVEDSADDAIFVQHALRDAGISATLRIARDGAQALGELFGAATVPGDAVPVIRPRLIILDLNLPKIDGLELLRRLKANPHSRTIPTVVLSSSQEERDLEESYRCGVNSYVVKPIDYDGFVGVVARLGTYWLWDNHVPP